MSTAELNKKGIDLRKHPYRGILKEIGEEIGRASSNVHISLFGTDTPDPKLAELFNKKLQERKETIKSFRKNIRKAV
jgi:hypothetical protein